MPVLRRFLSYIVLALLIVANVVMWQQRTALIDTWRLYSYKPPADIAALANAVTMTDYGKRLFYVNHPQLENRESFNKQCADHTKETAVLGCYHGDRQGIHIYAVTDARLDGVHQVTAAHEMLHQAYDRLSAKERAYIDGLLVDFVTSGLTDQDVKSKLASYEKLDVDMPNEMHSILGTEVRTLSEPLETYYRRYFSNRLLIVAFREAYQAEFSRRKALVEQYDTQLTTLGAAITSSKATLNDMLATLRQLEKRINDAARQQDTTNYEGMVDEYNAQVDAYNATLVVVNDHIERYNTIVGERNAIATEEQQLQQALDSRYATTEQR